MKNEQNNTHTNSINAMRLIRRKEMEQLIKLIQGLLDGEFELKEYTRSNKENDDNTITMSFGFDVIKKPHIKNEQNNTPTNSINAYETDKDYSEILNKDDDEHLLTKVIIFGNNRAARYARDSYLDSHPSAHWIKGTQFVKDGEWLIRYATPQNFEGTRFNEVVIDGSLLLSVNTGGMTRITNELRATMITP